MEAFAAKTRLAPHPGTDVAVASSMLRIVRREVVADQVVLILQGHITEEWAEVLEGECMELSLTGHRVAVDLSGVAFIGRAGLQALGRLVRGGVTIRGCSPLMADMLEQEGIEVDRTAGPATNGKAQGGTP